MTVASHLAHAASLKASAPDGLARLADSTCMHAPLATHAWRRLVRVFKVPHGERPNPLYLRRDPRNRFDPPGGGFRVLYAAFHLDVCLAEVLSRRSTESAADANRMADARYFVGELFPAKPLRVVDLTKLHLLDPQAADAMDALRHSQAFSEAVHRLMPHADGMIYRSTRSRRSAAWVLAVFERGIERAGLRTRSVVPLPIGP